MSEQGANLLNQRRNSRMTWIIVVVLTVLFVWFIYTATQSVVTSDLPMSNGANEVSTSMPQSMPGMNH
jgi:hypothetical protein